MKKFNKFRRKRRIQKLFKWFFLRPRGGLWIIITIISFLIGRSSFFDGNTVQVQVQHHVLIPDSLQEEYKKLLEEASFLEKHSLYSVDLGPKFIGAEDDLQRVYKKIEEIEKITEDNCPACIWARQRIDEPSSVP